MKYKAKVYSCLCSLKVFEINDIPADEYDFVYKYDHSRGTAEGYSCGNMQTDVKPFSADVLSKYGITVDEYAAIAEDIAEKLSFGRCSLCA
jgi:hypothetical protein